MSATAWGPTPPSSPPPAGSEWRSSSNAYRSRPGWPPWRRPPASIATSSPWGAARTTSCSRSCPRRGSMRPSASHRRLEHPLPLLVSPPPSAASGFRRLTVLVGHLRASTICGVGQHTAGPVDVLELAHDRVRDVARVDRVVTRRDAPAQGGDALLVTGKGKSRHLDRSKRGFAGRSLNRRGGDEPLAIAHRRSVYRPPPFGGCRDVFGAALGGRRAPRRT